MSRTPIRSKSAADHHRGECAFSLVEVIIVIVILGVIAALTIPQFSSGATESPEEHLRRDLAVMRIAIDMFYQQHGFFPGQRDAGDGFGEAFTPEAVVSHLTRCVSKDGRVSDQASAEFRYGPYLRRGVPACAVVSGDDATGIVVYQSGATPEFVEGAPGGWVYCPQTGYIAANSDRTDARGIRFDAY